MHPIYVCYLLSFSLLQSLSQIKVCHFTEWRWLPNDLMETLLRRTFHAFAINDNTAAMSKMKPFLRRPHFANPLQWMHFLFHEHLIISQSVTVDFLHQHWRRTKSVPVEAGWKITRNIENVFNYYDLFDKKDQAINFTWNEFPFI